MRSCRKFLRAAWRKGISAGPEAADRAPPPRRDRGRGGSRSEPDGFRATAPGFVRQSLSPRYRKLFFGTKFSAISKPKVLPVTLKYFDPSYLIRSRPANCDDSLLCSQFARNAVHAAMAGKTDVVIGLWYNVFVHVPIPKTIATKRRMAPNGELWSAALAATGQPACFM